MSSGKGRDANLSTCLESGVDAAELVKWWLGDVAAWCLPGYGVPLALILLKDGKVNALFSPKTFFPLKDREQGWTSLQESVMWCKVNSNVIPPDSLHWDMTALTQKKPSVLKHVLLGIWTCHAIKLWRVPAGALLIHVCTWRQPLLNFAPEELHNTSLCVNRNS